MRHSDIAQTMETYTHTSALALAAAVEKLPTFGSAKLNAPNFVKSSSAVSSGVPSDMFANNEHDIENTGESRPLTPSVPWWLKGELVRAAGFEPATPTV